MWLAFQNVDPAKDRGTSHGTSKSEVGITRQWRDNKRQKIPLVLRCNVLDCRLRAVPALQPFQRGLIAASSGGSFK